MFYDFDADGEAHWPGEEYVPIFRPFHDRFRAVSELIRRLRENVTARYG